MRKKIFQDFELTVLMLIIAFFFLLVVGDKAIPASNDFVLGGFSGPPLTDEQYKLYKEAGFNAIFHEVDYNRTLDLAEEKGLTVFLNVQRTFLRDKTNNEQALLDKIGQFVIEVRGRKANAGYFLYDEPNVLKTADLTLLALVGKRISTLDPERITWFNFHDQSYANSDYSQRAVELLDKYTPSVISVHYYPFIEGSKDQLDQFYMVQEWIRSLSLKYKVPYWSFIQSAKFPYRRLPLPSEMRMQAYSCIAYGTKGIWYYTYISSYNKGYDTAILDKLDKPTSLYAAVKELNKEISNLAPILMRLKTKDVMHTGPVSGNLKQFVPNRLLSDIKADKLLIGIFNDENESEYVMLVNKDTARPQKDEVITFGESVKSVVGINKKTGKEQSITIVKNKASFIFEPGEAILLKLITK